jgi:hypothetical protein
MRPETRDPRPEVWRIPVTPSLSRGVQFASLALLTACATVGEAVIEEPAVVDFSQGGKGKGCQGGCALVRDPHDSPSPEKVEAYFAAVGKTPVGSESDALDQLLFHDEEARARLAEPKPLPVPAAWEAWLRRELGRRHATFGLRIIDEHGKVRAQVPDTRMALGSKLHMEVEDGIDTGPFNANGTLVRVSRDRLWIRM